MFNVEEYINFMRDNADIPHKSKYHEESFIDHVYGVILQVIDTKLPTDNRVLLLAAALHDIRKPYTIKVVDGNATFHNHENVCDADLIQFLDKSDKDFYHVLRLINHHMIPYYMKGPEPWASEACYNLSEFILNNGSYMGSILLMLNEFDSKSKNHLTEKQRKRVESYLILNTRGG